MKKSIIILIGIVLLTTISLALNINLQVTPTKSTFYDNESVSLDVNITNYELSLAAQNAKVIVKINEKNISIPLGNIEPDKTIIKTLELGKYDAGTYRLETYLEHEFLGITDRTQVQYQNIRVLPSIPIRMKTHSILVTAINIPEGITVNREFTIEFDVNSSTDSGFVEFGVAGEKTETKNLKEGTQTIKRTYKLDNEGSYLLEIKAYIKQDGVVSLKDYKTRNFVVIDLSKYERIEYKPIEKKKGEVIIDVGKEPERNLIEEIGCFIVGGCRGDLTGPEIKDIEMLKQENDKYIFRLTTDDTKTGSSKVTGCYIRIESSDWKEMTPSDGAYDSVVEKATSEIIISSLKTENNVEFECIDKEENIGYASYKAFFGCKENSECAEEEVCSNNKCEKAKLILAFVPINWKGSISSFNSAVDTQASFLIKNIPLSECPEKIKIIKIPEKCNYDITCGCSDLEASKNCANRWTTNYDYVIGLTDGDNCGSTVGFSCGSGIVYVEKDYPEVTAHELGHEFGLRDEYCAFLPPSPNVDICGPEAYPNPLSISYGCDVTGGCCWGYNIYGPTCFGNKNSAGGRSIMSFAGAPGPRAFDIPSIEHLKNNPKLNCRGD